GVTRMEELIADLLELSRLEAQEPHAAAETAIVGASLDHDLRPSVARVGGALRIDIEPETVRCTEGLLCQALSNLGENAVKYRRPDVGLEVEIRGRRMPDFYEFRVRDNGSGMSPRETRQAFDPFFRGEQARAQPGTGLGLSIVKRIVESTGGTISLESVIG